jgi:type I restriction enzyme, S subunit
MFKDKKIVIGRVGAYCGCVHVTHQQSWVTDNALYVDEFSNELNFEYLAFALDIANLNKVSSQSGQPLVSGARIYRVNILVPPLEDQAIFVKKLKLIDSHKIKNQRSSSLIKDILSSLKAQAFSGQL